MGLDIRFASKAMRIAEMGTARNGCWLTEVVSAAEQAAQLQMCSWNNNILFLTTSGICPKNPPY